MIEILYQVLTFAFLLSILTLLVSSIQLAKKEGNWAIIFTSWEFFHLLKRQKKSPKKEIQYLINRIIYSAISLPIFFALMFLLQWIKTS